MNAFKISSLIRKPVVVTTVRSLFGNKSTEPIVAAKGPFCEQLSVGTRYSWCSCGLSKKQPFCDGSHKGSGMRPHRMKVEEVTEVWFCGCKHTKTPPYCDGSHMSEEVVACTIGEKLEKSSRQ